MEIQGTIKRPWSSGGFFLVILFLNMGLLFPPPHRTKVNPYLIGGILFKI